MVAMGKFGNCEDCGYWKKLTAHHIIYKKDGGTDADENIKYVCRSCHDKIHENDIQLNNNGGNNGNK